MNMGERFAMPIYPAAMSPLAQPTIGPVRWHHTRHAASALSFASAALTLVASFLPLYSTTLSINGLGVDTVDPIVASATAWGVDVTGSPGPTVPDAGAVLMSGYPLVFACFILVAAAVVSWFAAIPGALPVAHRTAAMSVGIGAAFLAGTVWTVSLQSMAVIDSVTQVSDAGVGIDVSATFGVGHWLLLTAALLAAVATVLVLIPAREPRWTPVAVDPNMATPPYGIALLQARPMEPQRPLPTSPPSGVPTQTLVDPLTGLPYATAVDPTTGMPPLGPIVVPDPPPAPPTPPTPAVPPTEDPLAEPRRD
jgi:hypothetical protein